MKLGEMLIIGLLVFALLALSIGLGLTARPVNSSYTPDPSPRWQYLGSEYHNEGAGSAPAYIHVYLDKVTHDEIACFAGDNRESLSCLKSGRVR